MNREQQQQQHIHTQSATCHPSSTPQWKFLTLVSRLLDSHQKESKEWGWPRTFLGLDHIMWGILASMLISLCSCRLPQLKKQGLTALYLGLPRLGTTFSWLSIFWQSTRQKSKQKAPFFDICDKTFRTHSWDIIRKISLLYSEVIEWPEWWGNPDNPGGGETQFIITVDGTHCPIEEPALDDFNEQRKYCSHKFKSAGLDYEVALSIFEQKCVWVAGPYPAGKNDITIFRHGLKQKMLDARAASGVQYRALADKGYRGEAELISISTSQDTTEVRTFKGRALSRQETFNTRLKYFDCLDERFRHGIEKHSHCFYACVVIVQLQMDNGFELFQV